MKKTHTNLPMKASPPPHICALYLDRKMEDAVAEKEEEEEAGDDKFRRKRALEARGRHLGASGGGKKMLFLGKSDAKKNLPQYLEDAHSWNWPEGGEQEGETPK